MAKRLPLTILDSQPDFYGSFIMELEYIDGKMIEIKKIHCCYNCEHNKGLTCELLGHEFDCDEICELWEFNEHEKPS
jgi:hypothetical protein